MPSLDIKFMCVAGKLHKFIYREVNHLVQDDKVVKLDQKCIHLIICLKRDQLSDPHFGEFLFSLRGMFIACLSDNWQHLLCI